MGPIITLLTDFGEGSPYVAQMKGVILSWHPQVQLVDITHSITPQDVRQDEAVALSWPMEVNSRPTEAIPTIA
jgi:S-adenosylmethionine hydrolase